MVETLVIDPDSINEKKLAKAADLLRAGKLVVFPTETVYGLGANALDEEAARNIFEAKGRPRDNPVIIHISDEEMLHVVASKIPEKAQLLIDTFWPGPLTIIFPKSAIVPNFISAGLPTIGVRMPEHPIARKLIELSGIPIAAPSANLSGNPSPTRASHVYEDLKERVDLLIDGGNAEFGLESTIIDVSRDPPVLLRPGAVSLEDLKAILGEVEIANPNAKKPLAPGMKYRHYAPKTKVILVDGKNYEERREKIRDLCDKMHESNEHFCVLGTVELFRDLEPEYEFRILGSEKKLAVFASNIFNNFRDADKHDYSYLVVPSCNSEALGLAINNRLRKAASKVI